MIGLVNAWQATKRDGQRESDKAVLRGGGALAESLETLRWKVGDTIYYPFEHAQENVTLARFVLPDPIPPKEDIQGLLQLSEAALDRLLGLYSRVLGRLALTAEEVERVSGRRSKSKMNESFVAQSGFDDGLSTAGRFVREIGPMGGEAQPVKEKESDLLGRNRELPWKAAMNLP